MTWQEGYQAALDAVRADALDDAEVVLKQLLAIATNRRQQATIINDLATLLFVRTEKPGTFQPFLEALDIDPTLDAAWENVEFLEQNNAGGHAADADNLECQVRTDGLRLSYKNDPDTTSKLVPNIIHMCFGFTPDFGGKPFSLVHYLTVKSAYEVIKPREIKLHYKHLPHGPWWQKALRYLTPLRFEPPTEVFGRPLRHPAHQTDVVRLDKLIDEGGIYLDVDVLCLRPLEPLRIHPFVMGRERNAGLCNAVILSERNASFAKRWRDEFRSFRSRGRDQFWGEHAVLIPGRLAEKYPNEIHILEFDRFFWPLYDARQLAHFFRGEGGEQFCGNSYCVHLWEQIAWDDYLKDLTVEAVLEGKSEFCRLAAPYLND